MFWSRDATGQPERFYVVAEKALSITADCSHFGSAIEPLKKRLRKSGATLFDTFPPYGALFRRLFGGLGEQALELFLQTVSMKSVGNLTDFVRHHMLEPFDVAPRSSNCFITTGGKSSPTTLIRPLWVAAELGLTFEHVPTPYQGGATRTPAFLALNRNGHIPVVIDHRPEGEVVVWESMACALYLARHHGVADGASLTPATAREDAEALRWSLWTVNEVEKDALTVLMHRLAMPPDQRKPDLADVAERRLHVPLRVLEQHLAAQQARGEAQDRKSVV